MPEEEEEYKKIVFKHEYARAMCRLIFPLTYPNLRMKVKKLAIDNNGCVYINEKEKPKLCIDGIPDPIPLMKYIENANEMLLSEFSNIDKYKGKS